MFYIYRITNNINGKTYIGQHKYKKLDDSYMGSGKILKQAYNKYGIENFKKEILVFNVSKKEHIDLLERTFIASERERVGVENCYNITAGGEGVLGYHHSEASKKKMSEANKGQIAWNKGIKTGKPAWNKGKPMSEEQKKKQSEAMKGHTGYWQRKHRSEETKKKISAKLKGKHWKLVDGKRVWY